MIDEAYDFSKKVYEMYDGLIKVFLVAKGGTVRTNGDELPVIYDVHRHLGNKLGMKKGHTLFIRPDGHVAFRDSSSDLEKTLEKVRQFFS